MYAVIRAGGKQYRVAPGDVIRVEKVGTGTDGDGQVEFPVLAVSGEEHYDLMLMERELFDIDHCEAGRIHLQKSSVCRNHLDALWAGIRYRPQQLGVCV